MDQAVGDSFVQRPGQIIAPPGNLRAGSGLRTCLATHRGPRQATAVQTLRTLPEEEFPSATKRLVRLRPRPHATGQLHRGLRSARDALRNLDPKSLRVRVAAVAV